MSNWPTLIITTDTHDFVVVDIDKQNIVYKSGPTPDLDRKHLAGQGRPTFRPFGVDYDDEFIYVASNDAIGKFDRNTYTFVSLLSTVAPLFINTHQIYKSRRIPDRWYICNTGTNTISIYQKEQIIHTNVRNFTKSIELTAPKDVNELDTCHLNSITPYEADPNKLLILKNNGKRPNALSEIWLMDAQKLFFEKLISVGIAAHNIVLVDETLYTLSTGTGRLMEVDLKTNSVKGYDVGTQISFLRGLDVYENKLVIGNSVHRKFQNTSDSTTIRTSEIVIFDTITKKSKSFMLSDIKVINDLKLLK